MKIAVLDDDPTQLQLIEQALLGDEQSWSEMPECLFFEKGLELLELVKREPIDLVILDRKVPDMSGDVILSWLRQYSISKFGVYTLVIMLTSLGSEEHELYSLNSGADDYIAKPFSPVTLLARVKRLLTARKTQQALYQHQDHQELSLIEQNSATQKLMVMDESTKTTNPKHISVLELHGYQFNFFERVVTIASGEKRILTEREFNLAVLFFNNLGVSLAREDIFRRIWPLDKINQRSLDTHVHRLRIKLNLNIENGLILRTVYGYGYRLDGLVSEE